VEAIVLNFLKSWIFHLFCLRRQKQIKMRNLRQFTSWNWIMKNYLQISVILKVK